jgi:IS5 family transposase
LLQRAERIRTQMSKDKNKLYAMHAPEVECIGKGKARKPYEFGVKASIAVTHAKGFVMGARTFPGNPYDGHTLTGQIEQTITLVEGIGAKPTTAIVDLGYRGVDQQVQGIEVIHRSKTKRLCARHKAWLRRRQAVDPVIGHTKTDHRMDRRRLKGAEGDALHAVLCATGFSIRWLMRAIVAQAAKAAKAFFFAVFGLVSMLLMWLGSMQTSAPRSLATGNRATSVQRWSCQYGPGGVIEAAR